MVWKAFELQTRHQLPNLIDSILGIPTLLLLGLAASAVPVHRCGNEFVWNTPTQYGFQSPHHNNG